MGILCCFGSKSKSNPPPRDTTDPIAAATAQPDPSSSAVDLTLPAAITVIPPAPVSPTAAAVVQPPPSPSASASSGESHEDAGGLRTYTFGDLSSATGGFSDEFFLGKGGFGVVYRGILENEPVAIKRLLKRNQRTAQFNAEVEALKGVDHVNIMKLLGYSSEEDEKILVYELISSGTLSEHLHGLEKKLTWSERVKVAAGTARALEYLHCSKSPSMVHRDVNSSNIMLDQDLNAKLCDFGWARKLETETYDEIVYKFGYISPEYRKSGLLSLSVDVYSFGVVLLEIFTGQRASDVTRVDKECLADWAQSIYRADEEESYVHMADPVLRGQYPKKGLQEVLEIALRCVDKLADNRPSIANIVSALNSLEEQSHDPTQFAQGSQGAAASSSSVLQS